MGGQFERLNQQTDGGQHSRTDIYTTDQVPDK